MADRRMFSRAITDSETFLDFQPKTQMLYFHLAMHADDDGFVSSPKRIQKMVGASEKDLDALLREQFVIPFESGVCVIRHWRIHNYIRSDRYKETVYKTEKRTLSTDENNAYILDEHSGIPNDYQVGDKRDTQVRLGKDRLSKSTGGTGGPPSASTPSRSDFPAYGEFKNVHLSDDEIGKLKDLVPGKYLEYIEELSGYIESQGKKYKNHYATIRNWIRRDAKNGVVGRGAEEENDYAGYV